MPEHKPVPCRAAPGSKNKCATSADNPQTGPYPVKRFLSLRLARAARWNPTLKYLAETSPTRQELPGRNYAPVPGSPVRGGICVASTFNWPRSPGGATSPGRCRSSGACEFNRAATYKDAAPTALPRNDLIPPLRDCSFAIGSCGPPPIPQLDSWTKPRGMFLLKTTSALLCCRDDLLENKPLQNPQQIRLFPSSHVSYEAHCSNQQIHNPPVTKNPMAAGTSRTKDHMVATRTLPQPFARSSKLRSKNHHNSNHHSATRTGIRPT